MPRTTSPATTATVGEADVDAAVADGRIESSERPVWLKRFEQDEHFTREVLNTLPSDPVRGELAFEQDARLRSLGDQFDEYMGVSDSDRVVDYEDGGMSDFERNYLRLAELTNEHLFR